MQEDKREAKEPQVRTLILIASAVVSVQALIGIGIITGIPSWETRGQFGDIFGAANALFSALAFAALIYTINLQRYELHLQREELRLTRRELERSAKAQELSEAALRAQAEAANATAHLSAVSFLLEFYKSELAKIKPGGRDDEQRVKREAKKAALKKRIANLNALIEGLYDRATISGANVKTP